MKFPFVSRKRYEELEYKLECLLCHATGNRLSKSNYTLKVMEDAVTEHVYTIVDEAVTFALSDNYSGVDYMKQVDISKKFNLCFPTKNTLNNTIITKEALETAIKNIPESIPIKFVSEGDDYGITIGHTTCKPQNISFDSDRNGVNFEIDGVLTLRTSEACMLEILNQDSDGVVTNARVTAICLCKE